MTLLAFIFHCDKGSIFYQNKREGKSIYWIEENLNSGVVPNHLKYQVLYMSPIKGLRHMTLAGASKNVSGMLFSEMTGIEGHVRQVCSKHISYLVKEEVHLN